MKNIVNRKTIPLFLLIIAVSAQLSGKIHANLDILVAALAVLVGFQYFVDAKSYEEDVIQTLKENKLANKEMYDAAYANFSQVIEDRDKLLTEKVDNLDQRMSKYDMNQFQKPKKEANFF